MYEESLRTEDYKGYKIDIYHDDDPSDPREWGNISKFIFFHSRYSIGDKHNYSTPDAFAEELEDRKKSRKIPPFVFPVYMYDHSGIGFSMSRDRYPYNCPWDSGQVGWIVIECGDIRAGFPKLPKAGYYSKAFKIAKSELDTYNDYVQSNVYGYVISNGDRLDPIIEDSCWGYYGDFDDAHGALTEAKAVIDLQLNAYKPKD